MRKLLIVVLLVVLTGLIGLRRGWFQVSSSADQSKVNVTVDKDKIHEDEAKVADKLHDAKDKVVETVDKVK